MHNHVNSFLWWICFMCCFIAHITISNGATTDKKCPVINQCGCYQRKGGVKIVCRGLRTVSFQDLQQNVVADIDLSFNFLEELNNTMFPNPNKIKKLNLKGNQISEIKANTFKGFTFIKKIDLSYNLISQINDTTFAGLEKLDVWSILNLQRNRILSISARAFGGFKVSKLILGKQLNISDSKAPLVGYEDFLSFSWIKFVNLDDNNLLCDCNLKWLINWVRGSTYASPHQISMNSTCEFPVQIRGKRIGDLVRLGDNWKCGAFESDFHLPLFQITPPVDQLIFEKDSLLISCHSTWVSHDAYFEWQRNGAGQNSKSRGVTIQHYYNVSHGYYASTMFVKKIKKSDTGNFSCTLIVLGSGTITAHTNVVVLNTVQKTCKPTIIKGDRGEIYWPTAFDGAQIQTTCPYGGLTNQLGFQKCYNSTYEDLLLSDCKFRNRVTRTLQGFFNDSKSNESKKIVQMGKSFYLYFRQNYMKIKSKYDLYFIYQALHKIMKTYSKMDKTAVYSGFFWGTLGLISQTYVQLQAMNQELNGILNRQRFRSLVESFIQQEAERTGDFFKVNNHPTMAALSYTQTMESISHCYIKDPRVYNQLLQVYCSPERNKTVEKTATINLQFYNVVGFEKSKVRITTVTFKTDTFFQRGMDKQLNIVAVSPIVGIKIRDAYHDDNTTIKQALITFKDKFTLKNPKLMIWQKISGQTYHWQEYNDCSLLDSHQRFLVRFQCHFLGISKMTYFTLAMDKPVHVYLKANYMEIVLYVAAGISCYFLACTLLIYFIMSKLRFNRSDAATLMNLCLALIVSEFIFAFGMHRTDDELLCKGVAMALHYFLLCALVWLGCGGIVLIRLLNKKKSSSREYDPVLKYYLVGWGLPLIICSVTIAYDRDNYGTANYCWLVSKSSLAAFICPGALILLTDLIIFCCLHALINRLYPEDEEKNNDPPHQPPAVIDKDACNANICKLKVTKNETDTDFPFPKRNELINYLHGCLSVLLLFCLTFTFALMMYSYKSSGVQYLYYLFTYGSACCNFFLGGSILYFHCLKRKDIRDGLKEFLLNCCKKKVEESDAAVTETLLKSDVHSSLLDVNNGGVNTKYSTENNCTMSDAHSNYGAGECLLEEHTPVNAEVRIELCESYDGRGASVDNVTETVPYAASVPPNRSSSPDPRPSSVQRSSSPIGRESVNYSSTYSQQPPSPKQHIKRSTSPLQRPPSPVRRPVSPGGRKAETPQRHRSTPIGMEKSVELNESDVPNESQAKSQLRNSHPGQNLSDASEVEKQSVGGCNSIGDCSLTSGTQKRVRPVNPDIPENIKDFVPQDWKPARRRRRKPKTGESYYPYFNTDITPMTASYAYSSKSSSIASTTVSGVPLYINKKRPVFNNNNSVPHNKYVRPQMNNLGPSPTSNMPSQMNNSVPVKSNAGQPNNLGPPVSQLSSPHTNSSIGSMIATSTVNNVGQNMGSNMLSRSNTLPLNKNGPLRNMEGFQPVNNSHPQKPKSISRPVCYPNSPGTPSGTHKNFPHDASFYPPINYPGVPVNVVKPLPQERTRYTDSGGSSIDIYSHSDVVQRRISEERFPPPQQTQQPPSLQPQQMQQHVPQKLRAQPSAPQIPLNQMHHVSNQLMKQHKQLYPQLAPQPIHHHQQQQLHQPLHQQQKQPFQPPLPQQQQRQPPPPSHPPPPPPTNDRSVFSQRISEENEDEEEQEKEVKIKVAPIVYIPVPHISMKQYEKRIETSV